MYYSSNVRKAARGGVLPGHGVWGRHRLTTTSRLHKSGWGPFLHVIPPSISFSPHLSRHPPAPTVQCRQKKNTKKFYWTELVFCDRDTLGTTACQEVCVMTGIQKTQSDDQTRRALIGQPSSHCIYVHWDQIHISRMLCRQLTLNTGKISILWYSWEENLLPSLNKDYPPKKNDFDPQNLDHYPDPHTFWPVHRLFSSYVNFSRRS